MDRSDAEIGREALRVLFPEVVEREWEFSKKVAAETWKLIQPQIDERYAALIQHVREAIRGDIEREVIERAISKGEVMRVVDLPGHDFIVFEES